MNPKTLEYRDCGSAGAASFWEKRSGAGDRARRSRSSCVRSGKAPRTSAFPTIHGASLLLCVRSGKAPPPLLCVRRAAAPPPPLRSIRRGTPSSPLRFRRAPAPSPPPAQDPPPPPPPRSSKEPQEIGISTHQTNEDEAETELLQRIVSQEMFDGIIREVVEEIGVPPESLTDPLFIGISRRKLNVRPTAFFYLKCNLKSEEIYKLYSRAQDGYESTGLHILPKDDLERVALRMPGCHRGGLALYELMSKSRKDA